MDEIENDTLERLQAEALDNIMSAFNEGYSLGRMHAEEVFSKVKGGDENKG